MSIEDALKGAISAPKREDCDHFEKQLGDFRNFEKRLHDGGYEIKREQFSIPLMDRVSASYLYN